MAKQKQSGLGRGFNSILSDNFTDNGGVTVVSLSRLEARAEQPRKDFESEALEALASSIKLHGVLQPLVVREVGGGFYQIIAGERRYRAAKLAGLTEVPVVTVIADDITTAQLAIVENVQREDLNPAEEAFAYRELSSVWNMTQEEIAEKIGKSRSAVANAIRLTELPENIMEMLRSGALSAGHCRALLAIEDREVQTAIAEAAKDGGMTVREIEAAVKKALEPAKETLTPPETEPINYAKELENKVRRTLGRKVKISVKGKEKSIKIYFEDNEDLDELLTLLSGGTPITL
ncbi:MAG: ParB/RepB/Spo0J family partition protein [Ruminococcaceae bacterium]|nr:ParB/RepB/Spo0J family partition protein [Oscillospiraceae bacterium]